MKRKLHVRERKSSGQRFGKGKPKVKWVEIRKERGQGK